MYATFVLNSSSLFKRDVITDKLEAALSKIIPWLCNQRAAVEWRLSHRVKPFIITELLAQCCGQGDQEILGGLKRNKDSKGREGNVLMSAMLLV